jgi:hypothetical protein
MRSNIQENLRQLNEKYEWSRLFGGCNILDIVCEDFPQFQPEIHASDEAKSTLKNFSKNRAKLTQQYYELFNRMAFRNELPSVMEIKWNKRMTKTAGFTRMTKLKSMTNSRAASIELSFKVRQRINLVFLIVSLGC